MMCFVDELILKRSESIDDEEKKLGAETILKQRQLHIGGGEGEGEGEGVGGEEEEKEKAEMKSQKCIVFCFFPENDLIVGQTFSFDFSISIQGLSSSFFSSIFPSPFHFFEYFLTSLSHIQRPFNR